MPEPEVEVEPEAPVEVEQEVARHDPDDVDGVAWRSEPAPALPPSING